MISTSRTSDFQISGSAISSHKNIQFNCVDSFSQLIQLGKGVGAYPLVDERKLLYFPFLTKEKEPTITKDLKYNYGVAYKVRTINQIGTRKGEYNCMFLGSKNDKFHFAIYY